MGMKLLRHPVHGEKWAHAQAEIDSDAKNGWVVVDANTPVAVANDEVLIADADIVNESPLDLPPEELTEEEADEEATEESEVEEQKKPRKRKKKRRAKRAKPATDAPTEYYEE